MESRFGVFGENRSLSYFNSPLTTSEKNLLNWCTKTLVSRKQHSSIFAKCCQGIVIHDGVRSGIKERRLADWLQNVISRSLVHCEDWRQNYRPPQTTDRRSRSVSRSAAVAEPLLTMARPINNKYDRDWWGKPSKRTSGIFDTAAQLLCSFERDRYWPVLAKVLIEGSVSGLQQQTSDVQYRELSDNNELKPKVSQLIS